MSEQEEKQSSRGLLEADTQAYLEGLGSAPRATNTDRAYEQSRKYFASWWEAYYGDGSVIELPLSEMDLLSFIRTHDPRAQASLEEFRVRFNAAWRSKKGDPTFYRLAYTTLSQRLAGIARWHVDNGIESPTALPSVKKLMAQLRASLQSPVDKSIEKPAAPLKSKSSKRSGRRRKKGRTPYLSLEDLRRVEEAIRVEVDSSEVTRAQRLRCARDLAMLLVGFASGGRRRSEIAGMRMEDLLAQENRSSYTWILPRSKTDQVGEGKDFPIKGSAAQALNAWIDMSGVSEGFVFRGVGHAGKISASGISSPTVYGIFKKRFRVLGREDLSPHSLRVGFVTEVGRQKIAPADGMALTGHRDMKTYMRYHDAGSAMTNPASDLLDATDKDSRA